MITEMLRQQGNHKIPGYLRRPDGYIRDPRYNNADRVTWEMPVKPDYEIVRKAMIYGSPKVIIKNELAASPKNQERPTLDKLIDKDYYQRHLMAQHLYESGFSTTPTVRRITSPIEIRPYSINEKISPDIQVQYAFGVQSVAENKDTLGINCATPFAVENGKIDFTKPTESDALESLAYVAHVRLPKNLTNYDNSPKEIVSFAGRALCEAKYEPQGKQAEQTLVEMLFKPKFEKILKKVEDTTDQPVKGILPSRMITHSDIVSFKGKRFYDLQGELVMAASFFI